MRRPVQALLVLVVTACGGSSAPGPTAPVAAPPPPTLADVERALLDAPAWRVHATMIATGSLTATVDATILAARGGRVRFDARGEMMDKPLTLAWVSDGARTSAGEPTAPETTEATAIGLVRMGALHNVAAMAVFGARAPDHAAGGAADWLVVKDEQARPGGEIGYTLAIEGEDAADVVVTVDATGRAGPVLTRRHIVVHFPQGDMTVEEQYQVELGAELPADRFVVGAAP